MARPNLPVLAAVALANLTLITAGLALASLNVTAPNAKLPLVLSSSQDDLARLTLIASQRPESLKAAERLASRALSQAPYNNSARMRLVYISTVRDRALSPNAERLFAQSYTLAPYDPSVAAWRTTFALNHWASLSQETQAAVRAEVAAFSTSGSQSVDIRGALKSISDPVGKVVATLWLLRFYGSTS